MNLQLDFVTQFISSLSNQSNDLANGFEYEKRISFLINAPQGLTFRKHDCQLTIPLGAFAQ